MYRLLSTFSLILLLVGFAPLAVAQDDTCEINVFEAIELLTRSQSQALEGDEDAALATIAEVQDLLDQVTEACASSSVTTPSQSVEPALPPASGVIAVTAQEGVSGYSITTSLDDLDALSFMNALELRFDLDYDDPDLAAVVFGVDHPREGHLQGILDFAQRGGRVLVLYDSAYTNREEINDFLRENLDLMIAEETITSVSDGSLLVYPDGALPEALHGHEIGVTTSPGVQLGAYILARTPGAEEGYVVSQSSGEERLMLYTTPDGRITFMPRTYFVSSRQHVMRYFFEDRHLNDAPDNEAAIVALLQYLLEGSELSR